MKCFVAVLAAFLLWPATAVRADDRPGRVTGIGGVFVVSKDPKALAAWYRDVLGISIESWGGAVFRYSASVHPPTAIWSAFPAGSSEFEHSQRDVVINLTVDDLDAFVTRIETKGVRIVKRDADAYGKFASFIDPDGTKIELWQPAKGAAP